MSWKDKAGMKFIKVAIKGMSKKKLFGILAICKNSKKEDKEESIEIENAVKEEWNKRNYDINELNDYLKILDFEE